MSTWGLSDLLSSSGGPTRAARVRSGLATPQAHVGESSVPQSFRSAQQTLQLVYGTVSPFDFHPIEHRPDQIDEFYSSICPETIKPIIPSSC